MTYWSVAAVLISACFLVYRHPPSWLRCTPPETAGRARADLDSAEPTKNKDSQVPKIVASDSPPASDRFKEPRSVVENPSDRRNGGITSVANPANTSANLSSPRTVSSQGLMPPPPPPSMPQRSKNQASSAALRVPSTGPLPQRGPPIHSQQRASGGLTAAGFVPTPNPRGKVLLSPGHSPMDWAELTRSGNLSGVPSLQRVTPSKLRTMTGRKGKPAWSSWQGKVYNITPYLPFHPGGEPELMKAAGRDGTKLFMDVHPWVNWENMLASCFVGVMVSEDYEKQSPLEEMD